MKAINILQEILKFIMKILKNIFVDIPMFFTRNSFTGDVNVRKDAIAIKESIKNIILTLFNERPFDPEFGTNLTTGLFENPNDFSFYVENSISIALERYEPRIKLVSMNSSFEGRTLTLEIKYNLINPLSAGNNSFDVFDSLSLGINTTRFLKIPEPQDVVLPFEKQFDIVFKYLIYRYEPGWTFGDNIQGKEANLSYLGISASLNPFNVGGAAMLAFQQTVGAGFIGASAGWFDAFVHPKNFSAQVKSAYRSFERARSPKKANHKFINYHEGTQDIYYDIGGSSNTFYTLGSKNFKWYPETLDTTDSFRIANSPIIFPNLQISYDNKIERVFIHTPYGAIRTSMLPDYLSTCGVQRAMPWISNRYSGESFLFDNYLNLREETTLRDFTRNPNLTRDPNAGVSVNGVVDIHLNKQYSGLTFPAGYFATEQNYFRQDQRPIGYTLPVEVGPPWIPTKGITISPFQWFGCPAFRFNERTLVLFDGSTFGITPPTYSSSVFNPPDTPSNWWPSIAEAPVGLCFEFGKRLIASLDQMSNDWGDKIEFIGYIGSIPYGPIIETFVPWMFYKDPTIPGNLDYFKWRLNASISHWKEKFKSPHDGFARVFWESGAIERTFHLYEAPGYTAWRNVLPSGLSFIENPPVSWAKDQYNYTFGPSGPSPTMGVILGNETFAEYSFKHDGYFVNNTNTEQSRYKGDPAPRHWSLDDNIATDQWTSSYNYLLGQRKWGLTYTDSIWKRGVCGNSDLGEMYSVDFPTATENGQAYPFYYNSFIEYSVDSGSLQWKKLPNTFFNNGASGIPWNYDRRFKLFYHYPLILALNATVVDFIHSGIGYYSMPFSKPKSSWFDINLGQSYLFGMEWNGSHPVVSNVPFPNRKTPTTPPQNYWTGDKSNSHFELLYACMKGGITLGLDSLYFDELYNQLRSEGATGFDA